MSETGTPFLSAVPFGHPRLRGTRRWHRRNDAHHAVMGLFPELPGKETERRAGAGILFRVESDRERVLVQHRVPLLDGAIRSVSLGPLLEQISVGQRVAFSCDLNAVRCLSRSHKRVPVTGDDALVAWLGARLSGAFEDVGVTTLGVHHGSVKGTALHVAHYGGTAVVADRDRATALVVDGIGRAKAYGCGMLTLALAD